MKLEGLITLYTAVMNLGELVKRLNLLFLVVVAGEILFLYSCWKSNQLAFVAGAQKGRGGGRGVGWRIGHRSARQCYSDMGIPIPKTLVIWAFSSHITLAIWVRVRVVQGMPISLGFWEWGCPKRVMPMSLWHRGGGGEPPPSPAFVPRVSPLWKSPSPFERLSCRVKQQILSELPLSKDEGKCEAFGVWGYIRIP